MKKKPVLIIIGLLCLFFLVSAIVSHVGMFDKNGWLHRKGVIDFSIGESKTPTEYQLVPVDKEDFTDISAHNFIKKVSSVLNAYTGKTYVTFVFQDGTGLYCPGSSIDEVLIYGTIDELGATTEDLYYITIQGNTVTKTEVPYYLSNASYELSKVIPQEYQNDSTWTSVKDGIAYLQVVWSGTKSDEEIAKEILDLIPEKESYEKVHIVVNYSAYEWTAKDGLVKAEYTNDFIQ